MKPVDLLRPALVALAVAPAAAGATAPRQGLAITVRLQHTQVSPARVSIRRGGSVTWRFLDGANNEAHNVTSVGGPSLRPSGDRQNGSYTVRFTRRGTYRYECTIHFNMRGIVVVR